jgi:hypothetical protein
LSASAYIAAAWSFCEFLEDLREVLADFGVVPDAPRGAHERFGACGVAAHEMYPAERVPLRGE